MSTKGQWADIEVGVVFFDQTFTNQIGGCDQFVVHNGIVIIDIVEFKSAAIGGGIGRFAF
jgi:hypothetical protein